MKIFKLCIVISISAASLYVNALSFLTSSASVSLSNSSSLPLSIPSSNVLSLRGSSLPSIILSSPFPLNSLSASSISGL